MVDEIEEDLLKDNSDELKVMMAHTNGGRMSIPGFPKPWLLKGKVANEYWQCIYERWME